MAYTKETPDWFYESEYETGSDDIIIRQKREELAYIESTDEKER